jgi:hypothetical protein
MRNDLIQSLYNLLVDESHWTQVAEARNSDHVDVTFNDPTACKWCLLGALNYITLKGEYDSYTFNRVQRQLAKIIKKDKQDCLPFHYGDVKVAAHYMIIGFNDNYRTTHADVLDVLKGAMNVVG